jgi:hypothetical protein
MLLLPLDIHLYLLFLLLFLLLLFFHHLVHRYIIAKGIL